MPLAVLEADVLRVVMQNTSDVEPTELSKTKLENYFMDYRTTDIVYEKIVERVQTDRTRNPLILLRSLHLLKKYLIRFVPTIPVIETLDQFCCVISAPDPTIHKTLLYIRALLIRKSTKTDEVRERRIMDSTFSGAKRSTGLRETRAQLQEAILRSNWLYSNRITFKKVILESNIVCKLKCLSAHSMFSVFGVVSQSPLELSNERYSIEQQRIEELICTVRNAKKNEEIIACKSAGVVRRNDIQLFQFKAYNQQEKLLLSEEELNMVVSAVVNPPTGEYESRLIASKILIKVLVDRFITKAESGSQFFMEIISDMFESEDIDTQLHAFNLLLNLSVHFNLWEDISLISFGERKSEDENAKLSNLLSVQQQLFDVLQQMLSLLQQTDESRNQNESNRVWATALNCLLFWTTKDGRFQKDMVSKIEITLLPTLLKNSCSSGDFTQRKLIRLLISLLYDAQNNLDLGQLKKVGGIFWILDQYVTVRSTEAQDNLFVVIFDYLASQAKKKAGKYFSSAYLEMLKRINAPQVFIRIFKVPAPSKFADSVLNFLGIATDEEWKDFSVSIDGTHEQLDRKSFKKVIQSFKSLSQKYLSLSSEFSKLYQTSVETGNISDLSSYLHSDRIDNRKFAELWLYQLLSEYWLDKNPVTTLGENAKTLFSNLITEQREEFTNSCQKIYISIIERLVLYLSFQSQSFENRKPAISSILSLFNQQLLPVLKLESLTEENARRIFDILWNFTVFTAVHRSSDPYQETTSNDCLYSLVVQGVASLPQQLKREVDIEFYGNLFENMTNKHYPEMRLAVLLVIVEKCMDPDNLENIGGIPFFRKLLSSRDPAIAYHASRFLIDQLEAEKPEEYKDIMSVFLNKAQQTNNETLVANSYLQIKALIRSSETGKL